ncbi:MAG: Gfo/Idh/MocA family oxidoreductase [Candidatus Latescibacteria bacterium]|nr:Gfo/Idh/MocA family oxidoreductase [Candidatus Latescibacterota bacterium]
MSTQGSDLSRRMFIGTALATGAIAASCGKSKPAMVSQPKSSNASITNLHKTAPDGAMIKAGLIGCGGRGRGAALNFLNSGPSLRITALADVFQDRVDEAVKQVTDKSKGGQDTPPENQFVGFDAYKKVIDSGVDVLLIATPPHFRPEHFAAAVAANKHVFMEKPVAVDPVGAKSIIESAGQARTKNLTVVTGTQRHHQDKYVETLKQVANGAIGDIVAARCYWNQNQLWYRERQPGWSDMEWMIRDWVNWTWLSGDHIVEQHVHNIDVINWFTGKLPVKAVGFGGRARRVTGDQFDYFSIDFEYEDGMHTHSMCRQVNGCANNVSEFIVGTKGSTNCADTIYNLDGSVKWKCIEIESGQAKEPAPYEVTYLEDVRSPYDQEHVDFVTSVRTGEPLNEARLTAESTMCAIMGRISAYTGRETTWKEMMDSDLRLGPTEYAMGKMDTNPVIPVPGEDKKA